MSALSKRIACLHTAAGNAERMDAALAALGGAEAATLAHVERSDLLRRAEAEGGLTDAIRLETEAALRALAEEADAVLLTCSTLGPAVEGVAGGAPTFRVDAALAAEAPASGGRVAVLYAVETTRAPTETLFLKAAAATGATVAMRLVEGAWDAFRAGDDAAYARLVAAAADRAAAEGADVVALAQASMAGALDLATTEKPVLASPLAGLRAALAAVG